MIERLNVFIQAKPSGDSVTDIYIVHNCIRIFAVAFQPLVFPSQDFLSPPLASITHLGGGEGGQCSNGYAS